METNRYSQFGEEVMIREELDRIGECSKWCFEVGAHDGITNSNTRRLIEDGWYGVLIEGDPDIYAKLEANKTGKAKTYNCMIGLHDLDRILTEAVAPRVIDVGVIDIDGQDFWVWAAMRKHRARLMLVEFSPYVADGHLPYIGAPGNGGYNQADEDRIRDLGDALGYAVVGRTKVNLLFCEKELI